MADDIKKKLEDAAAAEAAAKQAGKPKAPGPPKYVISCQQLAHYQRTSTCLYAS